MTTSASRPPDHDPGHPALDTPKLDDPKLDDPALDDPARPEESLSPAESLALIDAQRRATSRQLAPNPVALYLPWGLAYLVAFGSIWLTVAPRSFLPVALTAVLVAGSLLGAAVSTAVTLARSTRGVAGPSQRVGAMYGWSWFLGFTTLAVANSQIARAGVPEAAMSLIWSSSALTVVGLLLLSGAALWGDTAQYVLGVWVLVSGVLSVLVGYPSNFLVLALAGGGGFVVLALVSAARSRRTP